jgi:Phage tail tube protein, GTA-gp10
MIVNPARGEASILVGGQKVLLRPTFAALVAAEEQLGPLLELVERATRGRLKLAEMAALFWHCVADRPPACTLERIGEALTQMGLSKATPALKLLLVQILHGRA